MRNILLVRHGATDGNLKKRYIGTTDEPLCEDGIRALLQNHRLAGMIDGMKQSGRLGLIGVSPMLRCLQTAFILTGTQADRREDLLCFLSLMSPEEKDDLLIRIRDHVPDAQVLVEPQMRECDFGSFENKNYQELSGDPRYQAWIDSGGVMAFPEGESPAHFRGRCCRAFEHFTDRLRERNCDGLLFVHGGTIMSILASCGVDERGMPRSYYDWQVRNGGAYLLRAEEDRPGFFTARRIDTG